LSKINNELKVRRLTRLVALGKAKVISFKDLNEARAKRNAKEKAIISKGKRGYRRKSPALEVEAEAEAGLLIPKDKVARISKVEPAKALGVLWRAPVAKIY
ncbi:hypothetical protein V2W45_1242426, partial [Cenococcum geophilum]